MRFSTVVAAALPIAFAAAQATTGTGSTSSTGCNAMYIVDACISRLKPQRDACTANDWECLCNETINLLTCYNNCPGEDAAVGYQSEKTAWCAAASAANPTPTTTSKSSAATDSTSSPTAASDAKSTDSTSSSSTSAPSATGSSAAEMNGVRGAFVAVAGLVAVAAGVF